jgi:hypothetical protein
MDGGSTTFICEGTHKTGVMHVGEYMENNIEMTV